MYKWIMSVMCYLTSLEFISGAISSDSFAPYSHHTPGNTKPWLCARARLATELILTWIPYFGLSWRSYNQFYPFPTKIILDILQDVPSTFVQLFIVLRFFFIVKLILWNLFVSFFYGTSISISIERSPYDWTF